MPERVAPHFYEQPLHDLAQGLLGCLFVREFPDGRRISATIVEVEAYAQINDPASHSYTGERERNRVMFGPEGRLYVYFTYGMYYCCNVVSGPEGHGDAVLIRAAEPVEGLDDMILNRYGKRDIGSVQKKNLTNGPAKFCAAFAINKQENGTDLRNGSIFLENGNPVSEDRIGRSTRIGISSGKDLPWRYYIKENPWVSKHGKK